MSGRDFRIETSFLDHLKTRKLLARCGPEGVVALLRLWSYAAEHHPQGVLIGSSEEDLRILLGSSEDVLGVLVDLRFVDRTDDGFALHNWSKRQPWVVGAESRRERARHANAVRWGSAPRRIPVGSSEDPRRTPPFPSPPLPSSPNPYPPDGTRRGGWDAELGKEIREALCWTGGLKAMRVAMWRLRDSGLSPDEVRSMLKDSGAEIRGMTPLDWASGIVNANGKTTTQHEKPQAIPEAKPPESIVEMSRRAGYRSVAQYVAVHGIPESDWGPETRRAIEEETDEAE